MSDSYALISEVIGDLLVRLDARVKEGDVPADLRALALARTKLEESIMWLTAARDGTFKWSGS